MNKDVFLYFNGGGRIEISDGEWSHDLVGFELGETQVEATAVNILDTSMSVNSFIERLDYIADSATIVGHWVGVSNDEWPFEFDVIRNEETGQYNVAGTIQISVPAYNISRTVAIEDIIDESGQVSIAFTEQINLFVIVNGLIKGFFSTGGTAGGDGSINSSVYNEDFSWNAVNDQ
ncbi:MAG: hypothetical protein JXQ90_07760 [Cyclobacteriaceae bacterium]